MIRHNILACFCLLIFSNSYSQTYTYHPFPDSGIVWQGLKFCGALGVQSNVDWTFAVIDDTIINSHTYKKIGQAGFDLGCVREDSFKKVFFFNLSMFDPSPNERLLYDFSVSKGDSVFVMEHNYAVDSLDSVVYYGIKRKRFFIGCDILGQCQDIWIEGIGSTASPIGKSKFYPMYCPSTTLCQASKDTSILYRLKFNEVNYQACFRVSSIEINSHNCPKIGPNPVTNYFQIELSQVPPNSHFICYDALGKPVKDELINSRNTIIQRNNLPAGIYFWQLQSENQVLDRGKILFE